MRYLYLIFIFIYSTLNGQHLTRYFTVIDLPRSVPIHDSIGKLIQSSNYYFSIHQEDSGIEHINSALLLAESSPDEKAMEYALFENPAFLFESPITVAEAYGKKYYVDKAMEYARRKNSSHLLSYAYKELSSFYLSIGDLQEAMYSAEVSLSNAIRSENDTAKVLSFIQQGRVNYHMSKNILAMHDFSNAEQIIFDTKISSLEPLFYRNLAIFYHALSKSTVARELLFKGIKINEEHQNNRALVNDYIILSEFCLKEDVVCKNSALLKAQYFAKLLGDKGALIEIQKRLLFNSIGKKTPSEIIQTINGDSQLKLFLDHICPGNIFWIYGQVYKNSGELMNNDSAIYYFQKAEHLILGNAVLIKQIDFLSEFADINKKAAPGVAIIKYKRLLSIYDSTDNVFGKAEVYQQLREIYQGMSDIKNAYYYGNLFEQCTKKNNERNRDNEIALMMFQNELIQKERVKKEMLIERNRKFMDQYLLIATLIVTLFIIMLVMGFFHVGQYYLRGFSFLAFLLLFEYITLVSKKLVGNLTDGVPWMEFLLFLVLALLMIPMHNYLEHRIMGYVENGGLFRKKSRPSGVNAANGAEKDLIINTVKKSDIPQIRQLPDAGVDAG